ncbi:MAG: response regulator [Treponemataceae bacterium]|nr:response regulator [Treponemataceae bacterium]
MSHHFTVLLVEDDDAVRLSLRDFLKHKGYTVLVASEGVGAIRQLLDYPVDLVITDYRMEIFGGDYWIRFLQKFLPSMTVLVTSGFLQPEFPLSYPVIYKPFDYYEIVQKIEEIRREKEDWYGGRLP